MLSFPEGPEIRARSKFAMSLADEREAKKMSRGDLEKQNTRAEVQHREDQDEREDSLPGQNGKGNGSPV